MATGKCHAGPDWQRGYTILELIIILAIIGTATAVTTPLVRNSFGASGDQQMEAGLLVRRSALLSYYYDVRTWPPDAPPGQDPGLNKCPDTAPQEVKTLWKGPYLVPDWGKAPSGWAPYKWNNSGGVLSISTYLMANPSLTREVFLRR
ncbi:MAG: hypothetical protein HYU64_07715 [Armatimonadetes bacterium]|nr:hypothetical protein [Armatimonadota bacterium]